MINSIKTKILLIFVMFCLTVFSQNTTNTPNIIIFLVDDMGLMDSSVPFLTSEDGVPKVYPLNTFYKTPHLEQLAKTGIRFSNFYAHSVCSPSRTSLLTGQNSAKTRITNWIKLEEKNSGTYGPKDWNWTGLNKSSITLPSLLKQKGYETIHVGKAHFGPRGSEGENPLNLGFNINIAGNSIGHPGSYYGKDGYGHIKGNKKRAVPGLKKYHGTETFLTEALTLEAKSAISKAHEKNKPFFLHLAHYAVHAPFQADPRFTADYDAQLHSKKAIAYATLIAGIDKSLGDIVAHLKALDIDRETLILFLGDNGSDAPITLEDNYGSAFPIKGKKGMHWEGGMRVPFIASWATPSANNLQKQWPIAQNISQSQMGSILDIFPTLCEINNIDIEDYDLEGYSLIKQFKAKQNHKRNEEFLNHYPHKHRSSYFTSLVKNAWKVVYHYPVNGKPKYELFNLETDPFEQKNIAQDHPKQLKKMLKHMTYTLEKDVALYPKKNEQVLKIIMP
jgi:arylsulfatase A-like enzyme